MSNAAVTAPVAVPVQSTVPETFQVALAAHRRAGYDAGYARAVADVLAASVFVAEAALREAAAPADARAVLYRFIATLEAETRRLASGEGVVSDGLGI